MELSHYNLHELEQLLAAVSHEIQSRQKAERAKLREQVLALMRQHQLTAEEVLDTPRPRKVAAFKFVHPEHPEIQWTGRGRQPRWVREHLEAGHTLEQLAI